MDGFDVTKKRPICEACSRVKARTWECRSCGVVVCDHNTFRAYLDGGCVCKPCHRQQRRVK